MVLRGSNMLLSIIRSTVVYMQWLYHLSFSILHSVQKLSSKNIKLHSTLWIQSQLSIEIQWRMGSFSNGQTAPARTHEAKCDSACVLAFDIPVTSLHGPPLSISYAMQFYDKGITLHPFCRMAVGPRSLRASWISSPVSLNVSIHIIGEFSTDGGTWLRNL